LEDNTYLQKGGNIVPRHPLFTPEIRQAVNYLIKNDAYLVDNEVNERAITHKLAEYIQYLLPEWHVDCEYNRKLGVAKTVDFGLLIERMSMLLTRESQERIDYDGEIDDIIGQLAEELSNPENRLLGEDGDQQFFYLSGYNGKYVKRVYPDIIAHRRSTMLNKIAVEVKITGRSHNSRKNQIFDLMKLAALTDATGDYKYDVGFFITLPDRIFGTSIAPSPVKNSELNRMGINRHRVYNIQIK